MTGNTVVAILKQYLQDPDGIVWGDVYLNAVNESLKTIAMLRPDSTANTIELTLVANKYTQFIPADGARLLYITRNIATGKPIRLLQREALNELGNLWTPQAVNDIDHYIYDIENPTAFGVFPVPDSALTVELVYSVIPSDIGLSDTAIVPDQYISPVVEYCLYRLYEIETERINRQKAASHLAACYNVLGIKLQNEMMLKTIQEG